MSSHKRRSQNRGIERRSALKLIGVAGLVLPALSACGFRPLYRTSVNGGGVAHKMRSVEIAPIPGRVGQRVRNELIFKTTGGGRGAASQYRLDVIIRESINTLNVEATGEARGQVYVLKAEFKLVSLADRKIMFKGISNSRAALNNFESTFANVRARIDAENRAARTVADGISTRVAAYLSRPA